MRGKAKEMEYIGKRSLDTAISWWVWRDMTGGFEAHPCAWVAPMVPGGLTIKAATMAELQVAAAVIATQHIVDVQS